MNQSLQKVLRCGTTFILTVLFAVSGILLRYRLASRPAVIVEGEVLYKFIDLSGDFRSFVFEPILGKRKVWLTDGTSLYVSEEDFQKIWQENPHDMLEKKYTRYAVFEVRPLLFGGYGVAKLKELRVLQKPPTIKK